jgi:hypothetical protein
VTIFAPRIDAIKAKIQEIMDEKIQKTHFKATRECKSIKKDDQKESHLTSQKVLFLRLSRGGDYRKATRKNVNKEFLISATRNSSPKNKLNNF